VGAHLDAAHTGGDQDDEDGRWLLCDPCHDLWAHRTLGAWVRRAWTTQVQRAPWLTRGPATLRTDARAHLAGVLRQLLQRLDDGHRVTLD
jgi:hypothetical protein